MKKSLFLVMLLLGPADDAMAENKGDAPRPLELRAIMREMSRDMQVVSEALVLRDWRRLARHAERIANHDKPPMTERLKILGSIGTDVGEFRALDGRVIDAAQRLVQAAENADAEAALRAQSEMQTACGSCHERFRAGFLEHFY